MPVPTYSVGQVLGAADVNNWLEPLSAVATADQTTTSTSLINDNTLSVAVAASANYAVELFVRFNGTNAVAFVGAFTGPSGATLSCVPLTAVGGAANNNDINLGAGFGVTCTGTGTDLSMALVGSLATSSTAGTLQFQFDAGTAGTVTRRARSRLTLQRIG
jgi:hypothetical protein